MMEPPMSDERRHFGRIPFGIETILRTPEETYLGTLLDISLNGALLEFPYSPEAFKKRTLGWLKIRLENETILEFTVENAHIDGLQIGVKFTEFNLETLSHLRRLLELNSGDPDQVKKELHFLVEQEEPSP
jgi:hypothetical protein